MKLELQTNAVHTLETEGVFQATDIVNAALNGRGERDKKRERVTAAN